MYDLTTATYDHMACPAAREAEQQIHTVGVVLLHHLHQVIQRDGGILADEYCFTLWSQPVPSTRQDGVRISAIMGKVRHCFGCYV
jgi:predicted amino acid dehydrogenase